MATKADTLASMDQWLEKLKEEVHVLTVNEYVFWEIQKIIRRNKQLKVPSEFYGWMGRMYVGGMSVGIRRQLDTDTRSESLFRFLTRLKGNPSLISRKHYRSLYPKKQKAYADRVYDRFVGKGRKQPLFSQIDRQIETLWRRSAGIVCYANRKIAHMDATPPSSVPKFGDVGRTVRYLEKLIQHYVQLFRAVHLNMRVNIVYDWLAIFRIPWIR